MRKPMNRKNSYAFVEPWTAWVVRVLAASIVLVVLIKLIWTFSDDGVLRLGEGLQASRIAGAWLAALVVCAALAGLYRVNHASSFRDVARPVAVMTVLGGVTVLGTSLNDLAWFEVTLRSVGLMASIVLVASVLFSASSEGRER